MPAAGTLILPGLDRHPFRKPVREQPVVTGVGGVNSAAKVMVMGVPEEPDSMARLFQALSRSGVNVQTIVQSAANSGSRRSDVALVVPALEASPALAVLGAAQETIGFEGLQHRGEVGRVSVTGVGMRSSPDVVCTFLWTLSEAGIDVDLVEISETYVAAITGADQLADAERAVRLAFGMAPPAEETAQSVPPPAHGRALDRDIRWGYDLRGLASSPASRGS